jgi:glycolate oxidase FAD binding subunit
MLIRFESIAASVEQQSQAAAAMMKDAGFDASLLVGDDENGIWKELESVAADESRTLVKVSVLPSELPAALDVIDGLAGTEGYAAAGRAGAGVFLVSLGGGSEFQKRVIDGLRKVLPIGKGSAVVVRGSAALKNQLDVWGQIGDSLPLMQAVKQQFDPAGLLSPGRGPV